jgi:DNA-binding transcriptional MerR regulator
MDTRTYRIGELARLCGLSVRRIRFYSDRGLLPAPHRTSANYRTYTEADLARLDLIRALRAAGIGLADIAKVLGRRLAVRDVLEARLGALELELTRQRRLAAALRATLAVPDPTEADFRRFWTMTTLSQAEFHARLEHFFDRVTEGSTLTDDWKRQMIEAATPELPEQPSLQQIDAWNEIMAMITSDAYIEDVRQGMAAMSAFDPAAYAEAARKTHAEVLAAIAAGMEPGSAGGRAIAQRWLESSAKAMKREADAAFQTWHRDVFRKHQAHSARYQELLAILSGSDPAAPAGREWVWIDRALRSIETAD